MGIPGLARTIWLVWMGGDTREDNLYQKTHRATVFYNIIISILYANAVYLIFKTIR